MKLNRKWDDAGISRVWKQAGIERFAARSGIHTGKVVAGNLCSATRVKYATLGDTVTLTNRLETLNGLVGTDLLCTAEVLGRLPDDLKARAVSKGEHVVKGRETPVSVFAFS